MKHSKRILAAILSVIMMVSMLPSAALAAETDGVLEAESAEPADVASVQETENETVEEAGENKETENEAEEVQEVVDTEPAGNEEAVSEETENKEETAEEAEGTEDAEGADNAESSDQKELASLEAIGDEYVVTVTYDETAGVPEGAEVLVEEVKNEDDPELYDSYVEQAAEVIESEAGDLGYVKLLDIKIVDKDGKKVDLQGPVDVQIRLKDVKKVEEATQVVHFAGKEEEPEVMDTEVDGDTVAFATEGFSVYAVVVGEDSPGYEADNQRLTIKLFKNAADAEAAKAADEDEDAPAPEEEPWEVMYVKRADLPENDTDTAGLERYNSILYDPGYPAYSETKHYSGWKEWTDENTGTTFTTIEQFRNHVKTLLEAGVEEGDCIYLYPVFAFRLHYEDTKGEIFKTEIDSTDGESCDIDIEEATCPSLKPETALLYWVKKGENPADSSTVRYRQEKGEGYSNTITLTEDVTLTPVLVNGYRVIFDENDGGAGIGGASYTPEKVVEFGHFPEKPVPDPSRPGYSFKGWFTDPEDESEGAYADWENDHTNGAVPQDTELHLYAHWNPETTQYKVVIWIQSVEDGIDKTGDDITYIATDSFTESATSETPVAGLIEGLKGTAETMSCLDDSDLGVDSHGFDYVEYGVSNGWDNNTKINGQGNTVINLYYKRALLQVLAITKVSGVKVPSDNTTVGIFGDLTWGGFYVAVTKKNGGYFDLNNKKYTTRYRVTSSTPLVSGLYGQPFSKYGFDIQGDIYPELTEYDTGTANGDENAPPYYGRLLSALNLTHFGGNKNFVNNICYVYKTNWDNTLIYLWIENPDGTFKMVRNVANFLQNEKYKLPEIFGYEPTGYYMWEKGDHGAVDISNVPMPQTGWVQPDADGFIKAKVRGHHEVTILHVKYMRTSKKLTFKRKLPDREDWDVLKTVPDIKYEEPLSGDRMQPPSNDTVWGSVADNYKNYYYEEGAWYLDPEFKVPADLSTLTMGTSDITLYARIEPKEFHVRVFYDFHPDGDASDENAPYGPEENFWVDYDTVLSHSKFSKATKEGYSLIGYYTDPGFNNKWNWNNKINDTTSMQSMVHLYSGTDDPDRAGYPVSYLTKPRNMSDVGYDGTVGVLTLYALWYDESGGFAVRYVNPPAGEGQQPEVLYEDQNRRYLKNADMKFADAPKETKWPNGKRFAGWVLKDGRTFNPGDTFQAKIDYADSTPKVDATSGRTVYMITVTAKYVDKEAEVPTHIYWYMNYYNPAEGEETLTGDAIYFHHAYTDVKVNQAVEVPFLNEEWTEATRIPYREGYKFLGWARKNEADAPNGVVAVTPKDLYIRYDEKTKAYDICEVAADERNPYQGFYAVWVKPITFNIVHTDGTTEVINWQTDTPYDLTQNVKPGYLYGGYRIEENGDLETASGMKVVPTQNCYYYLREVSDNYLKAQVYITYYANYAQKRITQTYALMNVDKADVKTYRKFGMSVGVSSESAEDKSITQEISDFYGTINVQKGNETPAPLSNKNLFGDYFKSDEIGCDIGLIPLNMGYENAGDELVISAYFVTWDNVRVLGKKWRRVRFGDGCFYDDETISWKWSEDKNPGIGSGVQTIPKELYVFTDETPTDDSGTDNNPDLSGVGESSSENGGNSGSSRFNKLKSFTIQAPSEKKVYTVTKISGSETTTQEVEEGDCTGQITYTKKDGYMFAGWYTDKAFKNPADFSNVTADMEVYARYISQDNITLTLGRSANLIGSVPFDAAVSVKSSALPDDIEISCVKGAGTFEASLDTTKKVNVGTKKKPVYAYKHQGTVTIANVGLYETFTAQVIWTTPDGTRVEGKTYTVSYSLGKVTLK